MARTTLNRVNLTPAMVGVNDTSDVAEKSAAVEAKKREELMGKKPVPAPIAKPVDPYALDFSAPIAPPTVMPAARVAEAKRAHVVKVKAVERVVVLLGSLLRIGTDPNGVEVPLDSYVQSQLDAGLLEEVQ